MGREWGREGRGEEWREREREGGALPPIGK